MDDDNPFYTAHNFVTAAFGGDEEMDLSEFGLDEYDEMDDIIQMAITEDNVQPLIDNEANITAENIKMNYMAMAIINGSLKPLEWMLKRATLNETETVDLLTTGMMNLEAFKIILNSVTLNPDQIERVNYYAQESGNQDIIDIFSGTLVTG